MALVLLLVTFPNDESAKSMIAKVLEQKLAACILRSNVNSSYLWESQQQDDQEVVTLLKTNQENVEQLEQYISNNHPYEVPAILRINASANQDYETWLNKVIS
jgi:periplasmic divalent cation tolerance protein